MIEVNSIKDEKFLKNYTNDELKSLSDDIRSFILDNVSKTGGHLSSNLGIVDLTIALAKVFDFDKDIILFDVGHQSYTYKILTGRAGKFNELRKTNGLSGFQTLSESKLDHYETGHAATSISTGLGFAMARDMDKKDYNVISIIGDGSIGNGLAYEALNQIGDLKTKQIVILNDNQMSISENVGALHNTLDSIRAGKGYNNAKKNTKGFLNKTKFGRLIIKIIEKIKRILKKIYLRKATIFSEFGIEYFGPINGHDFNELIKYLNIAKNSEKPVILHVITQKGYGYNPAENDKLGKFHGIGSFNLETGETLSKSNLPSFSEIISSYVYNFAKKDKDIICITPGMSYGSKLETIKEKMPNQFIDAGIAEEHAMLLANGLALAKKKPILFIYSTFLQRAYDELVHDVSRCNSKVLLCIDRAGFVPGDGSSHQGIYDVSMLVSLPNIVVTAPKDAKEANSLLYTGLNYNGPFAIRYEKRNLKYDYEKPTLLEVGSWDILKKGKDGFIISYGDFINNAEKISEILKKDNISLSIINARFIKPFDTTMFTKILESGKPIFVYEESIIIGSLASLLANEMQSHNTKSILYSFGIEKYSDTFSSRNEMINANSLDAESIASKIKSIIYNHKD